MMESLSPAVVLQYALPSDITVIARLTLLLSVFYATCSVVLYHQHKHSPRPGPHPVFPVAYLGWSTVFMLLSVGILYFGGGVSALILGSAIFLSALIGSLGFGWLVWGYPAALTVRGYDDSDPEVADPAEDGVTTDTVREPRQ